MKPLFSEKINESLKKYQPTHVEKGLKCERCGSEYDLYKFAPTEKHP
ncbi:DNA replication protein DnaC, partial [Staphylococcus aureus]|nr:DNA replication protein DnaC [Staphylococcus aureus]MBG3292511.1 DNA replication protein DnaC [Staphylococcus aureus]MBG3358033.1 DNA replication protein DnaC [Staphylococcus aureus]MBG3497517.1 DNA replication protein DnaC [Staphylococcus aureus]MBG3535864.1 DNA replication protein DnaC [Staphylococcus aureus]